MKNYTVEIWEIMEEKNMNNKNATIEIRGMILEYENILEDGLLLYENTFHK